MNLLHCGDEVLRRSAAGASPPEEKVKEEEEEENGSRRRHIHWKWLVAEQDYDRSSGEFLGRRTKMLKCDGDSSSM